MAAPLLALLLIVLPCPWPAKAQPTADAASGPSLNAAVLAALDADAWPAREAATIRLLRDESLAPQQIAQAFAQPLSAEQRLRLMQVAEHHVIRELAQRVTAAPATASLGVALQWLVPEEVAELGRPAVRVEATLPGFPAYGVLQVGDLVVALDGQGIDPSVMGEAMVQAMRDLIQQRKTGETVELTILRDGGLQTLRVTLGSLSAMHAIYEPDTLTLQPPASEQWRKFQAGLPRR